MEELLNKLIDKGWKPSGKECSHFIKQYDPDVLDWKVIYTAVRKDEGVYDIHYTLRELVSKESGLWQFVCWNGMVNVDETEVYYFWLKRKGVLDRGHYYLSEAGEDIRTNNYEYRLIESALKDEAELEQFLLNNIIVGN